MSNTLHYCRYFTLFSVKMNKLQVISKYFRENSNYFRPQSLLNNSQCSYCIKHLQEKSEKFIQNSARVCVLSATSTTGQHLALLLKQNPLISHIYLCDRGPTCGLAADLRLIDTHCHVTGYTDKELHKAVRNADIIVMLGTDNITAKATLRDRLKIEGHRAARLATACVTFAPKALVLVCLHPTSILTPLVSEIYKRTHWYHPGRVVGSCGLTQMKLNSLLAKYQGLDPSSVHVPILGGTEAENIVPLFSRAVPVGLTLKEAKKITNQFRNVDEDAPPTEHSPHVDYIYAPNSKAYSINSMVTTMALGLLGDDAAIATALVRTNYITCCKHIVCTVKFGKNGVEHNYGIPYLTKFELELFEQSVLQMERFEHMAAEYLQILEAEYEPRNVEEAIIRRQIFNPHSPKYVQQSMS